MTFSVIILSTLILFAVADPQCGAGEQVCNDATLGATCYDPTIYSCPTGSKGEVLCGFQEHGPDGACGTICYDMVDYQCCNDMLYGSSEQTPCSGGTSAPTSAPTEAPPSTGTEAPPVSGTGSCGQTSCAAGLECCDDVTLGATCYDPSTYTCPVGSKGPVLCGNQEHGPDGACGTTCYDMVDYQCCNDQLYGADEETPCSSSPTSAPTEAPTAAPTEAPTSAPTDAQPTSGTEAPPASGTSAPTAPSCSDCGAGLSCCDDITLGPVCYEPALYTCPTGSMGPVLCGNQEHGPDGACGTTCYDMTDYKCCNDQLYEADDNSAPC